MKRSGKVVNEAWQAAGRDEKCRCSHTAGHHHHGGACTYSDPKTFKFCDCKGYRPGTAAVEGQTNEEGTEMSAKAKKAAKGKKAPKAARKAKGPKEPRKLIVTRYHATAKTGPLVEKLSKKENDSLTATLYRAIAHSKEAGITRAQVLEGFTPALRKAFDNNMQSTLFALRKVGLVSVEKKREEVKAEVKKAA